ncbi:putative protein phosphatase 2C 5 [Zea mays]|nr:putative protein phosphatase 2C 5 [Zea mays]
MLEERYACSSNVPLHSSCVNFCQYHFLSFSSWVFGPVWHSLFSASSQI